MKTILVALVASAALACPQFETQYLCKNKLTEFVVSFEEAQVDDVLVFDVEFSYYTDRIYTDGIKRSFASNSYDEAYTIGYCFGDTLREDFVGNLKGKNTVVLQRDYVKNDDGIEIINRTYKNNGLLKEKVIVCRSLKK